MFSKIFWKKILCNHSFGWWHFHGKVQQFKFQPTKVKKDTVLCIYFNNSSVAEKVCTKCTYTKHKFFN